jgi:hypothetical protein
MSPLIIISSLIALLSASINVRAILLGKAKPHRTTFFIFLLINLLALASLFAQHDRVAIYLALFNSISLLAIFSLSLKYGMGGWAPLDITCLLIALSGIALWKLTSSPVVGLYSALFANIICLIPTYKKILINPKTEVWEFWFLGFLSAIFNLLAIKKWAFNAILFPLFLTLSNLIIVLLIVYPRKKFKLKL